MLTKAWQKLLSITNPGGKPLGPGRHKLAKTMWAVTIGSVLFIIAFFIYLSFQDLPTFDELENPKYDFATAVYFKDNTEMGRLFRKNRVGVNYSDLSPCLLYTSRCV